MSRIKVAKNKPTLQTSEQQLAAKIINVLNEWMRIGSIENYGCSNAFIEQHFRKIVPEKYHPNKYLEFRKNICNELWMDSIVLTLKAKGKDGLAKEVLRRQDKFIMEATGIDKNLEPTNVMHLPNRQLIRLAARLRNALGKALPCLGTQPPSGNDIGQQLEGLQTAVGRVEKAVKERSELAGKNIKKKKGRPRIRGKKAKWRTKVYEAWQKAKEGGVSLSEFCDDANQNGIFIDGVFTKPKPGEELDAGKIKTFRDWYKSQK